MVFKLLLAILTLLVIENQAHSHTETDRYDLYKYGLLKNLALKRDDTPDNKIPARCPLSDKTCPIRVKQKGDKKRKAWDQQLMDILRSISSMPHDDLTEPFILVSDDYEEKTEK